MGTSLVVQRLRLQSRGPRVHPDLEMRSHLLQLKIPCATNKTQHSHINTYFFKKEVTYCMTPLMSSSLNVKTLVTENVTNIGQWWICNTKNVAQGRLFMTGGKFCILIIVGVQESIWRRKLHRTIHQGLPWWLRQ